MTRVRSPATLIAAAAALGLAAPAAAQSPLDASLRGGTQFVRYEIKDLGLRISELAVPVVVAVPLGSRLTIDIGSAYAFSQVVDEASGLEEISGLTDTQIRGNLTLGEDWIILTAGVTVPTGQSTVQPDQLRAATLIANELLGFPIPSMGGGLGTTGGFAVARPLGEWNVGFGASMRYTAEYEPYDLPGTGTIRYQPGNEYRGRLGADHSFIGGRAAAGITYSSYSNDRVGGGSVYGSGDRWVFQAGYNRALWGADWNLTAWDLFRSEGIRAGRRAPTENMIAGAISAAFDAGGLRLEPNIEGRYQASEGTFIGSLLLAGLRARVRLGPFDWFPSGGYTIGVVSDPGRAENPSVTGWRAALTMRYR